MHVFGLIHYSHLCFWHWWFITYSYCTRR